MLLQGERGCRKGGTSADCARAEGERLPNFQGNWRGRACMGEEELTLTKRLVCARYCKGKGIRCHRKFE